jgi:hypothetical protein
LSINSQWQAKKTRESCVPDQVRLGGFPRAQGGNVIRRGPRRDVLTPDRGSHQACELVGGAGKGRGTEFREVGGILVVVYRRAIVAQGEQRDQANA